MSNVELGGATAFTKLNISVHPSAVSCSSVCLNNHKLIFQKDALFWYNLYRDGDGDYLMEHAACPVLIGNKWVSNRWIHEKGQELLRPCAINQHINEQFVGDLSWWLFRGEIWLQTILMNCYCFFWRKTLNYKIDYNKIITLFLLNKSKRGKYFWIVGKVGVCITWIHQVNFDLTNADSDDRVVDRNRLSTKSPSDDDWR